MTSEKNEERDGLVSRPINILLAAIVAVAVIGFFVGTSSERYDAQLAGFGDETRVEQQAEPARTYRELMEDPYRKNRHFEASLKEAARDRPALTDEVERTEEMTALALEERAAHRAYEGAPPTVPHPIREIGAMDCMACHGEGLKLMGRLAPPMSHDYLANCTQCHVAEAPVMPAPDRRYDELPVDNHFVGLQRWGEGERLYPGAPPTTPHPTHMREDCMSCHGTIARPGLRTTHPWQTQCAQCHAPSATLDQRPIVDDLAPFWD